MSIWVTSIHELQFVDDGKKKTVAPNTTFSLSKEIYDEFEGLNAARRATEDEIAAAKARGVQGVTETSVEEEQARAKAEAEAAAAEAAKAEQAKADAKASAAVAAESDRNREEAKQTAAKPTAAKAAKPDPLD